MPLHCIPSMDLARADMQLDTAGLNLPPCMRCVPLCDVSNAGWVCRGGERRGMIVSNCMIIIDSVGLSCIFALLQSKSGVLRCVGSLCTRAVNEP